MGQESKYLRLCTFEEARCYRHYNQCIPAPSKQLEDRLSRSGSQSLPHAVSIFMCCYAHRVIGPPHPSCRIVDSMIFGDQAPRVPSALCISTENKHLRQMSVKTVSNLHHSLSEGHDCVGYDLRSQYFKFFWQEPIRQIDRRSRELHTLGVKCSCHFGC